MQEKLKNKIIFAFHTQAAVNPDMTD